MERDVGGEGKVTRGQNDYRRGLDNNRFCNPGLSLTPGVYQLFLKYHRLVEKKNGGQAWKASIHLFGLFLFTQSLNQWLHKSYN